MSKTLAEQLNDAKLINQILADENDELKKQNANLTSLLEAYFPPVATDQPAADAAAAADPAQPVTDAQPPAFAAGDNVRVMGGDYGNQIGTVDAVYDGDQAGIIRISLLAGTVALDIPADEVSKI